MLPQGPVEAVDSELKEMIEVLVGAELGIGAGYAGSTSSNGCGCSK